MPTRRGFLGSLAAALALPKLVQQKLPRWRMGFYTPNGGEVASEWVEGEPPFKKGVVYNRGVADGVTDDTAAVQSAIDYPISSNSRTPLATPEV